VAVLTRRGWVCVLAALVAFGAAGTVPATSASVIAKGRFGPTKKYTGTGTATVERRGAGRIIRTSRDFSARGAVRLRFYLATGPSAAKRVDLGPMAKRGAQTFRLPRGVSIRKYRYAIAWCVAVDEPITQAVLR
jgi:hypothetical protein